VALCEMCGKDVQKTMKVMIDRAVMSVCQNCARFGKPVTIPSKQKSAAPVQHSVRPAREPKDILDEGLELALDYPKRIREARAKMGWKQEELAAKVNEKKSVIKDLEAGTLVPDNNVVMKLERVLKIKLLEKPQTEGIVPQAKKKDMTIGDFIR